MARGPALRLGGPGRTARAVALAVPALLLAGAYIGQYAFGLYPCEMCWWQRWPHFAALAFAALAYAVPSRWLVALAAGGIASSGAIAVFHAGVEYGWWEGVTACAAIPDPVTGQDPLEAIMNAPLVRCDQAPWTLLGISLAGYNALLSLAAAAAIAMLLRQDLRR